MALVNEEFFDPSSVLPERLFQCGNVLTPRQSNPRGLQSPVSNSALQDSGVGMQFVFSSYNDETDL